MTGIKDQLILDGPPPGARPKRWQAKVEKAVLEFIERHPPKMIALDIDSSVSPTHGDQEGTAYNGHFGCSCYHPLFVINQFGDLERCTLRPGNVHKHPPFG